MEAKHIELVLYLLIMAGKCAETQARTATCMDNAHVFQARARVPLNGRSNAG